MDVIPAIVPFVGGRINTLWPLAYNQLCPKLSVQLPIEPVVVPFSVTVFHWARRTNLLSESVELNATVPALAVITLIAGSGLAVVIYRHRETDPVDLKLLRHKFYFDEFYGWLTHWTQELLARVAAFVDRWIIDTGAVGGSSRGTWGIGALLRLVQVGNLQAYVFLFGLGVVAVIYFAVFR